MDIFPQSLGDVWHVISLLIFPASVLDHGWETQGRSVFSRAEVTSFGVNSRDST